MIGYLLEIYSERIAATIIVAFAWAVHLISVARRKRKEAQAGSESSDPDRKE